MFNIHRTERIFEERCDQSEKGRIREGALPFHVRPKLKHRLNFLWMIIGKSNRHNCLVYARQKPLNICTDNYITGNYQEITGNYQLLRAFARRQTPIAMTFSVLTPPPSTMLV